MGNSAGAGLPERLATCRDGGSLGAGWKAGPDPHDRGRAGGKVRAMAEVRLLLGQLAARPSRGRPCTRSRGDARSHAADEGIESSRSSDGGRPVSDRFVRPDRRLHDRARAGSRPGSRTGPSVVLFGRRRTATQKTRAEGHRASRPVASYFRKYFVPLFAPVVLSFFALSRSATGFLRMAVSVFSARPISSNR